MTTGRMQFQRLAILCVAGFAIANAAFYALSGSYFDSHHELVGAATVPTFSAAQAGHVRGVFAAISGVIAAVSFAAGLWRRGAGHLLAAVLGLGNFIAGVEAVIHGYSKAAAGTLLITGALMPVLAWFSYRARARGAWAFLVAMCGVLALAGLFGAPKVRGVLDISLWTTMIVPGLFAVAAIALGLRSDDYVDREPIA